MTGASIAHHLLTDDKSASTSNANDKDLDVVMLEAREACWGATGRNGGHCQPLLFESPHDPSIGHFELANFHTLQSLIKEKNIDCEFVAQPGVRAIYSQHHLEEAEMALSIMRTTAPDLQEMMKIVTDKKELASYRIPTATGALVTNIAGRMWPYKFVSRILTDLLTSTELNGSFNLQTLTPVNALAPYDEDRWTVKTDRGCIVAKKVVLATNAYTSHLLPSFSDLIVPCRGQMSALEPLPSVKGDDRLKTSFGFLGDGLDDYLIQRPNERGGHLMFGGGRQHGPSMGVTDDNVIDEVTAKYLRSRLVEALGLPEGAKEFKAANEWSGIMGFSRDERPFVGPVSDFPSSSPRSGLYISAGYTGHGMPNTWLCGKAVALMVLKSLEFAGDIEWATEIAAAEVGLPASYRLTKQRVERALEVESVEAKDQAEMARGGDSAGRWKEQERPPLGYA